MLNSAISKGKDKIRARVHKLITKKIAKHFDLDIRDDEFRFRIVEQEPAAEAVINDICKSLESIRSDVKLGKHGGKDNIGDAVRVGKAKHFVRFEDPRGYQQVQGGQAFRAADPRRWV